MRSSEVTCWKCKQKGHIRRDCPLAKKSQHAEPGKWSVAGLEGQRNKQAPTQQSSSFKAGLVRRTADGLTLTGTIAGKSCKLTVDTGSTISIIRPDVLNDVSGTLRPSTSFL